MTDLTHGVFASLRWNMVQYGSRRSHAGDPPERASDKVFLRVILSHEVTDSPRTLRAWLGRVSVPGKIPMEVLR